MEPIVLLVKANDRIAPVSIDSSAACAIRASKDRQRGEVASISC